MFPPVRTRCPSLARAVASEIYQYKRGQSLDARAEIANLSRNIVIRGNPKTREDRRGVHLMFMGPGEVAIQGVEIVNAGRMGQLARYPVHWHLAGDKSGDFLRDSSIHHSFQRCVTVHGTHNVEIANNVCFDHFGHGYFLEDGDETGNAFLDNLAIEVVPVVDDSECLVGIVSYVDLIGFLLKGR